MEEQNPLSSAVNVYPLALILHRIPWYQTFHSRKPFVTQVFSCLKPAPEGGGSTYADGFAVAERLRKENPEAFEFFTKTPISYQYLEDGYHLIAEGPVFRTDARGVVVQVPC